MLPAFWSQTLHLVSIAFIVRIPFYTTPSELWTPALPRSFLFNNVKAISEFTKPSPSYTVDDTTGDRKRFIVPQENPPVYLTLASLIWEKEGDVPASEKVVALDRHVFGAPNRPDIIHLCVNFYRDDLRQGTASTKTRGEVAGSGRKVRPQKGSGRARLGDARSPVMRGGGVAHGPKPRSFATSLPRKIRQMGLRVALSKKVREDALGIVESLNWPGRKTKDFAHRIRKLGWEETLFVSTQQSPTLLERVSRNIQNVATKSAAELEVYDLVKWRRVVLDTGAVEFFERLLGKDVPEYLRPPAIRRPSLRFSRMIAGRSGKVSPPIPGIDDKKTRKLKRVNQSTLGHEELFEATANE
ncbi:ribosomal protein L4 [Rickenella mellea]|uniref:Large ribosomal subunit protein uL4m n=1 Tax=Rickenella mellea TaxID=50990 RepID=A0A4Y7QP20_9AGAM|nr:ribosomal protein L4 [Rickenella mellea]